MSANATISRPQIISQKDLLQELDKLTAAIIFHETKAYDIKKKRKEFLTRFKTELDIFREFI